MIDIYIQQEANPFVLSICCKSRWHSPPKLYCAFLALCVVRTFDFAGWQLYKREQDERQSSRQWGRKSLWLFSAVKATSCRAVLFHPFRFLLFQCAAHFWVELFEALLEQHGKIAPSHRLTVVLGCRSNEPVLLWHFGQFMLSDARIQRQGQDDIWLRNSSWHTHTHTRCHMRCFKGIATAGAG